MSDPSGQSGDTPPGAVAQTPARQQSARTTMDNPALIVARALGYDNDAESLSAKDAFAVCHSEQIWLVVEGGINLFGIENAKPGSECEHQGVRHTLGPVSAGELIAGFQRRATDLAVLAIPVDGTRVVASSFSALHELARIPTLATPVAALLAGWIRTLGENLSLELPAPQSHLHAEPGELQAEAGITLATQGEALWIRGPRETLSLCGVQRSAEDIDASGETLLPLTRDSWVRVEKQAALVVRSTEQWLADDSAEQDFAAVQLRLLELLAYAVQARTANRLQRIETRHQFSGRVFSQALRALLEVLEPKHRTSADLSADRFVAACQLVAKETGIELPPPAELRVAARDSTDPVASLARRGGFFVRNVALGDNWWQDDHGALLGRSGTDGQFCALIPNRGGGYTMVDPATGQGQEVTPELTTSLDATAQIFYAPFPQGSITPHSILGFALRGCGREVLLVLGMIVLTGLLSLATPVFTGWIMDPIIPEAQTNQLLVLTLGLIIAGVAMQGFSLVQALTMLRVEGRMTNVVQAAVWDRLLKLPPSFFRDFLVGDLANRAHSIDSLRQLLSSSVISSVTHAVIGLFSLALMFYYDWKLSISVLVVAAIYAMITVYIGRRVLAHNREILKLTGSLQGLVLQLLGAVTKLRATGSERTAFAKWAKGYARLQSIAFDQQSINNALVVFKTVFTQLALFAVILVIAWQGNELWAFYSTPTTWAEVGNTNLQQIMPTSRFVAFHVAYGQFLGTMFGLTGILIQITNVKPLYERVAPILSATTEDVAGHQDPGELRGDISFHNVSFRYSPDTPLVIQDVSLEAHPGEMIALVGPSGAGKSSMIRLLLGFDAPESGSIFLDDKDIANLDKRAMRRAFGVVLQSGRLLAGSIFHNITAGANLSRDQAWEAARMAGLDKDIEAMPMGLETFISEGATTLSGGQRQRLMIARAIVRKPRIVIFDEATSALDNETQNIVTQGLMALNSTRIVIAHRLSTIIDAHRIYVLDKGRIVEEGTNSELMAREGLFAAMARRQIA